MIIVSRFLQIFPSKIAKLSSFFINRFIVFAISNKTAFFAMILWHETHVSNKNNENISHKKL